MAKKKEQSKHAGGRPTEYNEKYHVPWVRMLARRGLTIDEIADELGVNRATVFRWKEKHPEFCDAINEGRETTDALVENALFRKALGGTYTETRMIGTPTGNGGVAPSKVEKITREVAPDTAAAIFWLKNRQPDKWRDKREVETVLKEETIADELSESLKKLAKDM